MSFESAENRSYNQLLPQPEPQPILHIKVYKRRWLMLGLYMFYSAIVNSQWIQYAVISNVVSKYYDVSVLLVDCTSMIVMVFFIILIFPVTYLTDKIGVRWSIVLGSTMCFLGTWIKCFSVAPDRFYTTLFGQAFEAVALTMVLPLPGRVAAKWFGSNEISTATSMGTFGFQVGISASFLLGPVIVQNHDNKEDIGSNLFALFLSCAILATINLALCLIFFQEEPRFPPNETRALQIDGENQTNETFIEPMKRLLTNRSFLMLFNSYGLNIGLLNALSTMLNQLYIRHFEGGEQDAGRIGLLITLTGLLGAIVSGVILDKTHKFKETAVAVYFLSLVGQIFFSLSIFLEINWLVYVSAVFLGFFMSGYLALGYDLAAEYTYPVSEAIPGGLINTATNIYGVIVVVVADKLFEYYGDIPVHALFSGALLAGLILTILTKDEQRRQDAKKDVLCKVVWQDETEIE